MPVVVRPEVVNESVAELVGLSLHQHFAGYLCLLRTAAAVDRPNELRPDFTEFFDTFLRVPNAPPKLLYLRPFTRGASREGVWSNENVAGSYASSSLREYGPFRKVVEVTGGGSQTLYSLREGHTQLALEHLAFGHRVPAVPLVIFLYRNFAFEPDGEPSLGMLVDIFKYEFGYGLGDPRQGDFSVLFSDESGVGDTAEMFTEAPA
jgi:hypothetical protein